MNALTYQCCFCGEGIGDSSEKSNKVDPCSIILIANWTKHESVQAEQQFFAHVNCFKDTLWKNVPVEVGELALELEQK
ncbi:hypothetical protein GCM10011613_28440 [Cellvibrio zantedeschiae]|uniref:Uncharacterized protein n=1 Tax=Cellvibrio zantedeschiae TaxID=1237077 RepID=A0ABQ3B6K8_9GAMM|nr:hypothetical protein [Cellvibrio zantedeschiae]GGY82045.1 hypothetical protein GCM10011613_28440 [Cellvibrio zantedeschiae]